MYTALLPPEKIPVNRSKLREKQRELLRKAKGRTVLLVTVEKREEDDKYVVDRRYFEELVRKLDSTLETLEIMADRKLFNQILAAAGSLDRDVRLGKRHSFVAQRILATLRGFSQR